MTIAELMVAMVIGLLVTLAIGSLFISTRQDYRQNDSTSKMQENVRFALELLTQDLRHSGFFGNIPDPIDIDVDTLTLSAPAQDCGPTTASGKAGLYNFVETRRVLSFGNQIADATAYYGTCLDAADEVKPDSSIFVIKRVAGEPTPPLLTDDPDTADDETTTDKRVAGKPYVYTNGSAAVMYTHPPSATLPISSGENWEYQPRLYFIDINDRLHRKLLNGTTFVSEPLAEGIEAIHIEFGIDTIRDGMYDGAPDYFYTPAVDADPAIADMNQAVSATIFVLARTTEPDPDINFRDTKSYQLGTTGPTIGPFVATDLIDGKAAATSRADYRYNYHRRVYATTIALKNIRSQVMSR